MASEILSKQEAIADSNQKELEVQRLKGENRIFLLELSVLRDAVTETCDYRRYFGRPCAVRQGSITVHDSGFTVPTTD